MIRGSSTLATRALLIVGLIAAATLSGVPLPDQARSVITVVTIAILLIVVVVAAWRGSLANDWVWRLLLLGLFIQLLGQTLWTLTAPADRNIGTAAWIDAIFLLSYLVTAAGLGLLIHRRGRDRDLPALLDAAVVTIAAGSVVYLTSVTPPWGQFENATERAIAAGYVIADLSLLALSCSLLRGADRRNPALLLIVGSLFISFASDALMDGIVVADGWQWTSPAPIEGAWLLAYAMMAAAIVHPAAAAATAPVVSPRVRLSWHGVLILAVAGLAVPLAAVYSQLHQGVDRTIALAAAGSALLVIILARLAVLVRSVQDQADVFERQARRDPLTGLPNRRTLDLSLARMITRAGHGASGAAGGTGLLTVAMIDLDHFKAYNDSHGHAGGDRLLRRTATIWAGILATSASASASASAASSSSSASSSASASAAASEPASASGDPERRAPLLARYGGEEFTLLAPGRSVEQVREILQQMQQATPDGQSFSAGLASWDGQPAEVLLAAADAQMYRAKVAGRCRIYPTTGQDIEESYPAGSAPAGDVT